MQFAGYVYIVEFKPLHVKIGRSKDPTTRLRTLATQSGRLPVRSWVSPACYNYGDLELKLHSDFVFRRTVGEYFRVDFDKAVAAAEKLQFDVQSEERDSEMQKQADDNIEKFGERMKAMLMAPIRETEKRQREEENKRQAEMDSKKVSTSTAAECLGAEHEDVIVTMGMSYDDFLSFGPLEVRGADVMLNDMHTAFLVMLLPTTDKTLRMKVLAAQRLASTYSDAELGIEEPT